MERVALEYSDHRLQKGCPERVLFEGQTGILGAGGIKTAGRRQER